MTTPPDALDLEELERRANYLPVHAKMEIARTSARLVNVRDFRNHDCQYFPGGVDACELCAWIDALRSAGLLKETERE